MGKSLLASKTFWLNLVALVITILGDVTHTFTLDAKTIGIISTAVAILNIVVRIFGTSQPITSFAGSSAPK